MTTANIHHEHCSITQQLVRHKTANLPVIKMHDSRVKTQDTVNALAWKMVLSAATSMVRPLSTVLVKADSKDRDVDDRMECRTQSIVRSLVTRPSFGGSGEKRKV
jgi:hypothetical protein